jgi:predicted CopG family antitoxin
MATKTISIELDVYERLKWAKRTERESFSSVLRRASWPDLEPTASEAGRHFRQRIDQDTATFEEKELDRLEAAQQAPRRSAPKR